MIDLHSHTTASDGQHTPAELLDLAQAAKVSTLAVTDHDTVAALESCHQEATKRGMRLVPGIEISITLHRREVHILGHFVDPAESQIASFAAQLRTERERRMELMVQKLNSIGYPVTMEHVRDVAGDGHLGRPHLARALMNLNYVANVKEAFDRFLADGRAAFIPRFEVTLEQAVTLIHGAGGTATVAHPGVSRVERHELEMMKKVGIDGMEVEHSDHPPSLREKFHAWAKELDVIPTAGSDFHGMLVAPNRHLGTASMKPEHFAALEARRH